MTDIEREIRKISDSLIQLIDLQEPFCVTIVRLGTLTQNGEHLYSYTFDSPYESFVKIVKETTLNNYINRYQYNLTIKEIINEE